jgi:hypothetical protein
MKIRLAPCVFAIGVIAVARAEVKETRENGFVIESIATAEAPPSSWDPAHTWSGSARNLKLEPRAGGCFCEKLPDGGSVQHGRVIFAQPGKQLRLEGALGPLQEMAVSGVLTFKLEPAGPGTRIKMTYRVAGTLTMESAKLAPLVDQVMGVQLGRLRSLASGAPVGH